LYRTLGPILPQATWIKKVKSLHGIIC
jgi:hypothetical protein